MCRHGSATPGEYANERSRAVTIGLVTLISSLPGRPLACIARASSAETCAVLVSMPPSAMGRLLRASWTKDHGRGRSGLEDPSAAVTASGEEAQQVIQQRRRLLLRHPVTAILD